jgi:hypothetical protein
MPDILTLGTGTNYRTFNTYKNVGTSPDGTPITLASGALRASINGGDFVNAGLTLSVDHDFNGASAVTGLHRVAIDVDDGTLALAAGDRLEVILSAGTVNSISQVGTVLFSFEIVEDGLTAAEITDVTTGATASLNTTTYAEPGQGAPGATITLAAKIGYLYKAWRNRSTQTATEYALYADDAATKDQEAACSDDATTFVRGEIGTGA